MFDKSEYWLELADDDILNAKGMFKTERYLGTGYFCHQAAEKALKAMIANITEEIPPRTHKLLKLADLAQILNGLDERYLSLLKRLTPLQVEARYPEYKANLLKTLYPEYCRKLIEETEDFLCWIKRRLEKPQ